MIGFQPLQQFSRLTSYNPLEMFVELVVIWLAVYIVWRFVEGTRAAGALKGIIFLVLLTLAIRLLTPSERLERLAFLYDRFLAFAALSLVIIFQPELRRALIRIGETSFFRTGPSDITPVVDALVESATFLSKNKFGAIVAIERHVGLRETIESGRSLNADISAELLQSIFWPNNPLHDMGVVIRRTTIVAAGVQFPLADPQEMRDPSLGTRHRAAVGLTRAVDALVVIVSEETGEISLAERGLLSRRLTPEALRVELTRRLAAHVADDSADDADDLDLSGSTGAGSGGRAA